jgi:hypothetical protein
VFVQAEGAPQVPAVVHVATALVEWPLPSVAHSVAPGAHTPWHDPELPLATHA